MRRRIGLVLLMGCGLALACAATASAQGASLQLNPQVASPGQSVAVEGGGFQSGTGLSDVFIRLSTRNGTELANDNVDTSNRIATSFPVPNLAPGWYLIIATQFVDANGRHKSFTPARARLRVVAAGGARGTAAGGGGGGGGGAATGPGLMLAFVGGALALLAAGGLLAVRRTHNRQPLGS